MTPGEIIGSVALLVWLAGIGGLAHAVPKWLAEDDYLAIGMQMMPERVAVVMGIVIVAWPVSMPALIVMKAMRERT